jgi:hypothetical protein
VIEKATKLFKEKENRVDDITINIINIWGWFCKYILLVWWLMYIYYWILPIYKFCLKIYNINELNLILRNYK